MLKPRPARLHALFAFFTAGPEQGAVPFLPPLGVTSFTLTTPVPAKALAATGFRAFGTRAVRLDIVDRIADALFDAAESAKGPCAFPANIVSLLGASNEEAEALVEALGWEKTDVTRQVAVAVAPAAEKVVGVSVTAEPVTGVPVEEMQVEEMQVEETPDGITPEVIGGEASDILPEVQTTAEIVAEADAIATDEIAAKSGDVETTEAAVPTVPDMETVTLWRRKRAKPERAPYTRHKGPPRKSAVEATSGETAPNIRPSRPRSDVNRSDGPRTDGPRPPRAFNKDGANRPPRQFNRDAENAARFSAAPPPPPGKIDPNNPFAVLAALKVMAPEPVAAKSKEPLGEERKKRKRKRTNKPRDATTVAGEIEIDAHSAE